MARVQIRPAAAHLPRFHHLHRLASPAACRPKENRIGREKNRHECFCAIHPFQGSKRWQEKSNDMAEYNIWGGWGMACSYLIKSCPRALAHTWHSEGCSEWGITAEGTRTRTTEEIKYSGRRSSNTIAFRTCKDRGRCLHAARLGCGVRSASRRCPTRCGHRQGSSDPSPGDRA